MVLPGIVEIWNYWTDFSDPQDFIDQSRAHGYETIGAAVDAYVVEMTGMHREWADLKCGGVGGDQGRVDVVPLPYTRRCMELTS